MLNLLLLYDKGTNRAKTIHIDETTGDVSTYVLRTDSLNDLEFLRHSLEDNCTISNYSVIERGGGKSLDLCFSCDSDFDFSVYDDGEFHYADNSLLGVLREMVVNRGKIVYSGPHRTEYHNLFSIRGSNSSFGLNAPVVTEMADGTKQWVTLKVLSNDIDNNFTAYKDLEFLLPQTPLAYNEKFITRLGAEVVESEVGSYQYDKVKINPVVPIVSELPIEVTSVRVMATVQLMLDAYSIVLPLVTDELFEHGDIKSCGYPSGKTAHGGFVEIKSFVKASTGSFSPIVINDSLREKFLKEVASIQQNGADSSVMYQNNSLYRMFCHMWTDVKGAYADKKALMALWQRMRTSYALLTILLLEIKMNLFFHDNLHLTTLTFSGALGTGIPYYAITVKAGGNAWRPDMR